MIMILSVMLTGTFIGAITLKKESRQDTPETEPVSPSEGSAMVPSTFKGSIIDEFGVEKEVMDLIVSYMDGIVYGEIPFSYNNLASAIKPGHPADILDEIISPVGFAAATGKTIEKEQLVKTLDLLKEFKSSFDIKEMSESIKHLSEYIEEKY